MNSKCFHQKIWQLVKEIKQNSVRLENVDFYFWVIFGCYWQNFIFERETRCLPVFPFNFEILPVFLKIVSRNSFGNSCGNLFYLWRIKPVLNHSKWLKYWTLDVSRTALYEITLVRLSDQPSLS